MNAVRARGQVERAAGKSFKAQTKVDPSAVRGNFGGAERARGAPEADLLALQNEITSRLANALGVELIAAEVARPTEHPDAFDYVLRGRAVLSKGRTPEIYREAIILIEHALALDPQSVDAQTHLAPRLRQTAWRQAAPMAYAARPQGAHKARLVWAEMDLLLRRASVRW